MSNSRIYKAYRDADDGTLPFLSKSRVMSWENCPRQFYHDKVAETDTDDSDGEDEGDDSNGSDEEDARSRGTRIHETFEAFYENARTYVDEHGGAPDRLITLLPDDRSEWEDILDPYITNFIAFETARLATAPSIDAWLPLEVEREAWLDETPPWMGFADALLSTASIPPEVLPTTDRDGAVLVDFKTGDTPPEPFREDGIYLELEYYATLFEGDYDITAVAGYYPKDDQFVASPRRADVQDRLAGHVDEMSEADTRNIEDFPPSEGALCCWGDSDKERCPYYDQCPSTWASPIDHEREFIELCYSDADAETIAEELNTTVEAVEFWAKRLLM